MWRTGEGVKVGECESGAVIKVQHPGTVVHVHDVGTSVAELSVSSFQLCSVWFTAGRMGQDNPEFTCRASWAVPVMLCIRMLQRFVDLRTAGWLLRFPRQNDSLDPRRMVCLGFFEFCPGWIYLCACLGQV